MPADAIVIMLAVCAFFALCAGIETVASRYGWLDHDDEGEEL